MVIAAGLRVSDQRLVEAASYTQSRVRGVTRLYPKGVPGGVSLSGLGSERFAVGNVAGVKRRRPRTIQRSACGLRRVSFIAGEFWDRLSVRQVRLVGLEEIKLTRAHERLGAALHIELAVDVVDVSLDRADGDN